MLEYRKARKIDVSKILYPIINETFPELYSKPTDKPVAKIYERAYARMIAGASASKNFTSIYASLIKHKTLENEFKIAIYGGALMNVVDDIFDHCSRDEISKFIDFTSDVLQSTIDDLFPIDNYNSYFEKNYSINLYKKNRINNAYISLAKLAFQLYCNIITLMKKKKEQKNNFVFCLQRVQRLQNFSLNQKDKQKLSEETLRKISADKGGYTALLAGYLIDNKLPSISKNDLYKHSKSPFDNPKKINDDSNNKYFWRRQFLYELGSFSQYIDDKVDVEEDKKISIDTIAIKKPLTKEEEASFKKRILSLFELAFKKDLFFIKYQLYFNTLRKMLDNLEQSA